MHKCQGTSQLLPLPGQTFNRTYRLRDSVIGQPGVAPTIPLRRHRHQPARAGSVRRAPGAGRRSAAGVTAIAGAVSDATRHWARRVRLPPRAPLVKGLAAVRALRGQLASLGAVEPTRNTRSISVSLAKRTSSSRPSSPPTAMRIEALADDGVVMRGQPVKLSIAVANNGADDVSIAGVDIAGLSAASASCQATVKKGSSFTCSATGHDSRATRRSPGRTGRRVKTRHATTSSRTLRSAGPSARLRTR